MSKIFYPTSEKLKFLLDSIHNREVALPDFQRDFVWDASATEELIESICQNFPAGSLLRIKNTQGFYFAPREFAGAPALNGHTPSYLILDGQQRLTSLYQALYGIGNYRYFINLGDLLNGEELEDCVFHLRKVDADRQYTHSEQAASLTMPFHELFTPKRSFEKWLDLVLETRDQQEDKKALKESLRDLHDSYLQHVEQYEFPMVTLSDETKAEAVCTIFETLNRTGVKLSVFDLLAARFWPESIRLRDLWEQAKQDHSIFVDFGIDPYYLLQVVSLITAKGYASCKRGDLLRMSVEQVQAGWPLAVNGMAEFLRMLADDCGTIELRWLPYNPIIVPGAAICASTLALTGPSQAVRRHRIERWFWCSSFGQRYEKSSNSHAAKDYTEAKPWFDLGKEPEAITAYAFESQVLRETMPRQRALYRGTIALIIREGSRDFHSGEKISAAQIQSKKIDDHHIFPKGYLSGLPTPPNSTLQDCILNRTLIDKATNIRISNKPPSVYLKEIEDTIGAQKLKDVLDSHLIPSAPDSALRRDDFEGFLEERRGLITERIQNVTS